MDLCAAPGAWSQVAVDAGCTCVAVDLKEMAPIPGVTRLACDVTAVATVAATMDALGGAADVVLCDGAPDVYGLGDVDSALQNRLVEAALTMALAVLAPGGCLVSKIYRSREARATFDKLARHFGSVICAKPRSSRNASIEAFAVARHFGSQRTDPALPIPFVSCGFGDDLDSDSSYPLDSDTVKEPVQMPINPAHLGALRPKIHIPDDDQQTASLPDHDSSAPSSRTKRNAEIRCVESARALAGARSQSNDAEVPITRVVVSRLPAPAADVASLAAWSALLMKPQVQSAPTGHT